MNGVGGCSVGVPMSCEASCVKPVCQSMEPHTHNTPRPEYYCYTGMCTTQESLSKRLLLQLFY